MPAEKGLLLINLGTPDAPEIPEVRKYLREFLMDPQVIDIAWPLRWFLVNALILPKRPGIAAEAYRKIWTSQGSPLKVHHLELAKKVQRSMGDSWLVKPAMRYGSPSIREAVEEFAREKISEITIFPLYPQYSLAATQTSLDLALKLAREILPNAVIKTVPPFYEDSGFISAFCEQFKKSTEHFKYDHILFSFHGLPERHVKKTDLTGSHCLKSENCCDKIVDANRDCYRAQCFATARAMAENLGLSRDQFTICFQSRLGRTPWIKPYTDLLYPLLPKQGKKKLAVVCPAFVADCLETLEEVEIRGRDEFIKNGGVDFKLVPSLNSSDTWVKAVGEIVNGANLSR